MVKSDRLWYIPSISQTERVKGGEAGGLAEVLFLVDVTWDEVLEALAKRVELWVLV